MRIIFSRKGFDQGAGGAPSPIIDGIPISLPIPTKHRSHTTYEDLVLGDIVEQVTSGKIGRQHLCHEDPAFERERCAFGQTGPAQSHLANQGVGTGDVFLFFGLFSVGIRKGMHHRIFGYLRVEEIIKLGSRPTIENTPGFPRRHPHTIGLWNENNTIYLGEGGVSRHASDKLRLTVTDERPSVWRIPPWLRRARLSYHGNETRWLDGNRLEAAARGQEFVATINGISAAHRWLDEIIEEIRG